MSRAYDSRWRSETMRAYRPVETPATDASTVYRQRWQRSDGMARTFDVLAMDAAQAMQMGALRLRDKYRQNPTEWESTQNLPIDRVSLLVTAILTTETAAEDHLREQTYLERAERRAS